MASDRQPFEVSITQTGSHVRIVVSGTIDEHADVDQIVASKDATRVVIDLHAVNRVNSVGVRAWLLAMRRMHEGTKVVFSRCPAAIVDQLNMVDGFQSTADVESFYAPRLCEPCDVELNQLIAVQACHDNGGALPDMSCPKCGATMELDDIAEKFEFLLRNNPPPD